MQRKKWVEPGMVPRDHLASSSATRPLHTLHAHRFRPTKEFFLFPAHTKKRKEAKIKKDCGAVLIGSTQSPQLLFRTSQSVESVWYGRCAVLRVYRSKRQERTYCVCWSRVCRQVPTSSICREEIVPFSVPQRLPTHAPLYILQLDTHRFLVSVFSCQWVDLGVPQRLPPYRTTTLLILGHILTLQRG